MSNEVFKLGWDDLENRIVHINQVPEGFENAICPDCRSPLIAANRNPDTRVNTTYFRHHHDSNCSGETLIHLWAKQVVADKLRLLGAEYITVGKAKDIMRKFHHVELRQEAEYLKFESCKLEKALDFDGQYRIPDVSAILETGEPVYIEIFVHNAVNDPRSDFYQSHLLNCLEIDLSTVPSEYFNNPELFENYVTENAPRKWVNCSLYSELDNKAQSEAEAEAKSATGETSKRRDQNRTAKKKWRNEHKVLIDLVDAYLQQDNQDKATRYYEDQLTRPGTQSFSTRQLLESKFRKIPEMVNLPLKGELGFHCHRIVWQWEIYSRLVIDGYFKATKATKSVKTTWSTRGYEKGMELLAWYDHAPRWSAETLYSELLKSGIAVRPICLKTEEITGEPILVERDRPEVLKYLKVKEWRGMPKPVCVIRRYLRELVNRGLLETMDNDYLVKQGSNPPLCGNK